MDHIDFIVNDGKKLDGIGDRSIDRIWSWDVFVHIQPEDVRSYVDEFRRVLREGGHGIIHHARSGNNALGWRSNMTAKRMENFCKDVGLEVVDQFDSWDDGNVWIWPDFPAGHGPDIVTVFRKTH
jgi:cyclopropane fatty-acyl-phospholipid synthase-like methyltransferase